MGSPTSERDGPPKPPFSFAGQAARPKDDGDAAAWDDLLLLSAESPQALDDCAAAWARTLSAATDKGWFATRRKLAYVYDRLPYRLALAAATPKDGAERLSRHLGGEKTSRLARARAPERPPKLGLVYSGNGPQWWGMGRELFAESRIFRACVEEIDALFAARAGWSLVEEMRRPQTDSRIHLMEIAQPLLFAQQAALTTVLEAAGITADLVVGHSVGEIAAAWASGALTLEQATEVVFHRSEAQTPTAGHGRMAALGVSADEALQAMADVGGWLELAAINSPRAVTVAGAPDALETLRDRLTAEGRFVRVLPLNYAFHSRAMDAIRGPLQARLRGLAPGVGRIPFISTVTGGELVGTALDGDYWWRNARAQVQFEAAISCALRGHDVGLFLEVGPHPVLKDYLQQIIRAAEHGSATALSTLRRPAPGRPAPELDTLKTAICSVYAFGGGDPKALFARTGSELRAPVFGRNPL